MQWRNSRAHWGVTAVLLHWLVALTVFGLFALGWWMTELDYYDPWYKQGPWIHKSIGALLFFALLLRLLWRRFDKAPDSQSHHSPWERVAAGATHIGLYVLLLAIVLSGYLLSTADGRAIAVFSWFEIPASLQGFEGQEDIAGLIHWVLACTMMVLAALHILGAVKHQLIDKDGTITRMLGRPTHSD